MEIEKIGERIRYLRLQKGYSTEEMAANLKMSCSGYSKIERGQTEVSLKRLRAIAEVLDCNCTRLLEGEDQSERLSLADLAHKISKIETALAIIIKEINLLRKHKAQE